MELIQIENMSFTYPSRTVKALDGINLSFEEGSLTVVCGSTGCGKSTLLRLMKRELAPHGSMSGKISVCDARVGFVAQNPEAQTVCETVGAELAFGLECDGCDADEIKSRCAEVCGLFAVSSLFDKEVSELSGGELQLLNLAAAVAQRPRILLLDEPTSQLDPASSRTFTDMLIHLRDDEGVTIIIAEHRIGSLLPAADRAVLLESGRVIYDGDARDMYKYAKNERLLALMPPPVELFSLTGERGGVCPLTVSEGRCYVRDRFDDRIKSLDKQKRTISEKTAVELRDVYFGYSKDTPAVLRGVDMRVREGEIFFILGENGGGKTTLLCVAAGLLNPQSGGVRLYSKKLSEYKNGELYRGNIAYVPQQVQAMFLYETVRKELQFSPPLPFDLSGLYDRHPYDLSGGEMQLCALGIALSTSPRVLLLDEITKGVDTYTKQVTAEALKELARGGTTVICVSHDIEFAALCADSCSMLFDGELLPALDADSFFAAQDIYTTAASRMTRGKYTKITTVREAAEICRLNTL